jgi:iron-sulfur cluster repair protein YtfE (RIC family)
MREKIDLMAQLVTYHEDIDALFSELNEIIRSTGLNFLEYTHDRFLDFFAVNLEEHFLFEEQIVFPAIVSYYEEPKTLQLIAQYTSEHKELLRDSRELLTILNEVGVSTDPQTLGEIITLFSELSKRILNHAKHENMAIVPLVRDNSTVRFITGRLMLSLKGRAKQSA